MASAKKSNVASPLIFTKSIKKSYLNKRTLPIPDSVYSKHKNGPLKGTLKLHLGSNAWQVQVTDGSLEGGWDAFCTENQLKENDSVYFRHNGGRDFSVEIFNNDGSAKAATPTVTGKKRGRAKSSVEDGDQEGANAEDESAGLVVASDKAVEIVEKLTAQLDESHELTFTVSKVPKATSNQVLTTTGKKPAAAKKRTPAKEDDTASTPVTRSPSKNRASSGSAGKKQVSASDEKTPEPAKKRTRLSPAATSRGAAAMKEKASPASTSKGKANKKKTEKTPKRSNRKAAASASTSHDITVDIVTDTDTAQEKKTPLQDKKRKSDSPKETARKSPRKETPRKQSVKKATPAKKVASKESKPKGKKASQAVDEDSNAVKQARAFKSDNPHVMVVMRKSNLQPCFYLNIPTEFAKAHMPSGAVEFDMLDETNKAWGVRWLGPPKGAFSGGWCYFAQDHKLALGDAIVMEVLPNKDNVKVHIFRADNSDPNPVAKTPSVTTTTTTTVAKLTVTENVVLTATAELEGNVDGSVPGDGLAIDVEKVVAAITEEPTPITVENGDARLEAAKEAPANAATPAEDDGELDANDGDGDGEDDDDEDYVPNEDDAGDGGDEGN